MIVSAKREQLRFETHNTDASHWLRVYIFLSMLCILWLAGLSPILLPV